MVSLLIMVLMALLPKLSSSANRDASQLVDRFRQRRNDITNLRGGSRLSLSKRESIAADMQAKLDQHSKGSLTLKPKTKERFEIFIEGYQHASNMTTGRNTNHKREFLETKDLVLGKSDKERENAADRIRMELADHESGLKRMDEVSYQAKKHALSRYDELHHPEKKGTVKEDSILKNAVKSFDDVVSTHAKGEEISEGKTMEVVDPETQEAPPRDAVTSVKDSPPILTAESGKASSRQSSGGGITVKEKEDYRNKYANEDTSTKLHDTLIGNGDNTDPFSKTYDNCIVGSGLSGSTIAHSYAQLNQTSLIIEKRYHIGGNCYDYIDGDTGIRVSLFGAHLFHTNNERVWNYVNQFGKWKEYQHKVLGKVEGRYVPIPVNIDTVNALFDLNIQSEEEMDEWLQKEQVTFQDTKGEPREPVNSEEVALTRVGHRLYELIFRPYTWKQWAKLPADLGPEVLSRIPVRNNHDARYFSDKYQALPKNGYTSLFENMLSSPMITVLTNTDYFDVKDKLRCDRLYYTGPIDTYFAHLGLPKLEYRSLSFERVMQPNTEYFQPAAVVNHPQSQDEKRNEVDFTRIVEYKHFLNQTSDHTVYFIERSTDDGEPYYPVPNVQNKELYVKYQEMAKKEKGVRFVGRLANYKYFNMDEAILNALEVVDEDTKGLETRGEEE